MKKIEFAYINALLADAAYISLKLNGTADDLVLELSKRMTPTQAQFIADNFEVLNSIETPKLLGSGFDAVVWKGREGGDYAGQIFVSMRGTQGLQDIADDVSLAIKGIPYQQIADMVNWWLANTASAGATEVKQIQVLSIGNFQHQGFRHHLNNVLSSSNQAASGRRSVSAAPANELHVTRVA